MMQLRLCRPASFSLMKWMLFASLLAAQSWYASTSLGFITLRIALRFARYDDAARQNVQSLKPDDKDRMGTKVIGRTNRIRPPLPFDYPHLVLRPIPARSTWRSALSAWQWLGLAPCRFRPGGGDHPQPASCIPNGPDHLDRARARFSQARLSSRLDFMRGFKKGSGRNCSSPQCGGRGRISPRTTRPRRRPAPRPRPHFIPIAMPRIMTTHMTRPMSRAKAAIATTAQ